jgi:serine protease Do
VIAERSVTDFDRPARFAECPRKGRFRRFAILSLIAVSCVFTAGVQADVPDALRQRQRDLNEALQKVSGAVVGVSDGMGVGSGVVINREGIVLTASHVVDSGRIRGGRRRREPVEREVMITFPDGNSYRGVVLGKNADADAAVLKITDAPPTPNGFPHAPMGRTTETEVGEWCFAVGHPGGFRRDRAAPVRVGRVLSVGSRTIVSDCAILLGDSGGPLFNLKGEVIGIHSMITSVIIENRHVAIDCYHDDWNRLLAGDRWGRLRSSESDLVESGFFGVKLRWRDFVPEVVRVLPQSPAEKAAIQPGDVLLKVGGEPIADRLDLGTTLDLLTSNTGVEVQFRRNGQESSVTLVTGEEPVADDEDPSDEDDALAESEKERQREVMQQLSENRRIGRFEKRTPDELKLFRPIVEGHRNSIVAIRDGGLLLCLGTVMSSDGYILTKASEMDGAITPEVIVPDGRRLQAREIASDHAFDLMLLKVNVNDLQPARFRTKAAEAGELALLQDQRGNPLIPTVVSVVAQAMEGSNRAFLGVVPESTDQGVRIREVLRGGAAERNGIRASDVILSVNGREVSSREDLIGSISQYKPGDKVAIRYRRDNAIQSMDIVLTIRFTNENPLLPLYDPLQSEGQLQFASLHAGGFPKALQIDADVYPSKVGGPLLDLEGSAIGIVIARADRYPTYAIPADSVLTVFDQLRTEGANRSTNSAGQKK